MELRNVNFQNGWKLNFREKIVIFRFKAIGSSFKEMQVATNQRSDRLEQTPCDSFLYLQINHQPILYSTLHSSQEKQGQPGRGRERSQSRTWEACKVYIFWRQ